MSTTIKYLVRSTNLRGASVFILTLFFLSAGAQEITEGRFCLTYFPQPAVETYMDSLADYLKSGFADENGNIDSITLDYISHFTTVPKRQTKCVYFNADSVKIEEQVDQDLTAQYVVVPGQNLLINKRGGGIMMEPYLLESSDSSGYYDFYINEDKNDVINIEGFPCHRIDLREVFYPSGGAAPREKDYVLYVTDQIKISGGIILGNNLREEIPCPLQVEEPLNNRVTIKYRASGLRFSVEDGTFSLE
ncbi:MAG: hypothetical protein KTR24_12360 [Saprospiraceae bacterium]|nr:hypothetical protein [Saprospiraceae bacterium]